MTTRPRDRSNPTPRPCCRPTLVVTFHRQQVTRVERRHWCGDLPEQLHVPTWLAAIPRRVHLPHEDREIGHG